MISAVGSDAINESVATELFGYGNDKFWQHSDILYNSEITAMDSTDNYTNMSMTVNMTALTNATMLRAAPYYALAFQVVGFLFGAIIFVVGMIGNVMVVIVVLRTRCMHTTTNCYLVSLAVADVLLLVTALLPTLIEYFLIIDQFILGPAGCALMVFTQYLGINVSSLSITAFTIERYIAICHPMKAQTMCTVKRAKRIIMGLWVFGISYCGPWLGLATTLPRNFQGGVRIEHCTFKMERNFYLIYYMADLVIFYIIPLLLTCVLYGLIARILITTTIQSTAGKPSLANGNTPGAKHTKRSSASSRVQVIKMLAIVVGMFAILWLPYRAFVVYNSFARVRYTDYWFMLFCRTMVYMNSAVNPILYNAMSVKFRRAFKRLLHCGKKTEGAYYSHFTQVSNVHAHEMK